MLKAPFLFLFLLFAFLRFYLFSPILLFSLARINGCGCSSFVAVICGSQG